MFSVVNNFSSFLAAIRQQIAPLGLKLFAIFGVKDIDLGELIAPGGSLWPHSPPKGSYTRAHLWRGAVAARNIK